MDENNFFKKCCFCVLGLIAFFTYLTLKELSEKNKIAIESLSRKLSEKQKKVDNLERNIADLNHEIRSCARQNTSILIKLDKLLEEKHKKENER